MADTRPTEDAADAERRLGRYAAIGIPIASVIGGIIVSFTNSLGPGILVLLGGALLGTISLLWASLRTLSGDAPLPLALEARIVARSAEGDLAGKKRRVLRGLKDLELEHSLGKIDDKDYAVLAGRFRAEAKDVLRELDGQVEPMREEAERIANAYLTKKGLGPNGDGTAKDKDASVEDDGDREEAEKAANPDADDESDAPAKTAKTSKGARLECPKCATSNEPDAAFCKKCGTALSASEEEADATG